MSRIVCLSVRAGSWSMGDHFGILKMIDFIVELLRNNQMDGIYLVNDERTSYHVNAIESVREYLLKEKMVPAAKVFPIDGSEEATVSHMANFMCRKAGNKFVYIATKFQEESDEIARALNKFTIFQCRLRECPAITMQY